MNAKLLEACALLLGPTARAKGAAILQHLDVAVVRRAYRVLAVATHPDSARRSGSRQSDGRRFVEASNAYELVMSYLLGRPSPAARGGGPRTDAARSQGARRPGSDRRGAGENAKKPQDKGPGEKQKPGDKRATGDKRHTEQKRREKRKTEEKRETGRAGDAGQTRGAGQAHTAGGSRATALFYHGPVPRRKLRLAEFLYYTGRISWQSLISAIVWQRAMQPKFGELAREMKGISSQDLARILSSRLRHEQTGQTAQRLRLLSATEVERVLRLQRARRRLIGRYFVEKESMPGDALSGIMHELFRHNARYGPG